MRRRQSIGVASLFIQREGQHLCCLICLILTTPEGVLRSLLAGTPSVAADHTHSSNYALNLNSSAPSAWVAKSDRRACGCPHSGTK